MSGNDMPNDDELSTLQKRELAALTGDRVALMEVVSALRQYRVACQKLWDSRYSDGEVDSVSLHDFESTLEELENPPSDDEEPYSSR